MDCPISSQLNNYITHIILANDNKSFDSDNQSDTLEGAASAIEDNTTDNNGETDDFIAEGAASSSSSADSSSSAMTRLNKFQDMLTNITFNSQTILKSIRNQLSYNYSRDSSGSVTTTSAASSSVSGGGGSQPPHPPPPQEAGLGLTSCFSAETANSTPRSSRSTSSSTATINGGLSSPNSSVGGQLSTKKLGESNTLTNLVTAATIGSQDHMATSGLFLSKTNLKATSYRKDYDGFVNKTDFCKTPHFSNLERYLLLFFCRRRRC
jgi:hypothetical protein